MTGMDRATATSATRHAASDFMLPWRDLRQRLNAATGNLRDLSREARSRDDSDNETRLIWKRDAIENAIDAWERINDQIVQGTLDHAGAWRTFTDQVAHLFTVPAVHPGYYEGVAVALSYQRGYAAHVDAPPFSNPHLMAKG